MIEIIIYLIVSIIIGLTICFKGKKLFFPSIMIISFLLIISRYTQHFGTEPKSILIGSALGIAFALIIRFIYKAAFFLSGFVVGAILSGFAINMLPQSSYDYRWVIILFVALIGGIFALKWQDFFIIVSTSLSGASSVALSICFLFVNFNKLQQFVYSGNSVSNIANLSKYLREDFVSQNQMLLLIVTTILFVAGFISQQNDNATH